MNALSKRARKLLKWISKHDQWLTRAEIQQKCKAFDKFTFDAITDAKLVAIRRSGDYAQLIQYRINDAGLAYLEERRAKQLPELRNWITAIISAISFLSGLLLSDPLTEFFKWLCDLIG